MNIVWLFLKKLSRELSYNPAIPLPGIHPRELKTYAHMKTYTWMLILALFIRAKKWKQTKCLSTDEWINKIFTHWNIILP